MKGAQKVAGLAKKDGDDSEDDWEDMDEDEDMDDDSDDEDDSDSDEGGNKPKKREQIFKTSNEEFFSDL